MTSATGASVWIWTARVSPKHGPRRAQVIFDDVARAQIEKLSLTEVMKADRAIVAVSVNPWLGDQVGRTPLRKYEEDGVVLIYTTTALGSIIIVAYLET